jgi:transcriptional regulator with XRE-family HTH domain
VIVAEDETQVSGADTEAAAAAARRELGQMLAGLREGARLTQRQLGRLTGYHHTVVGHSEKGIPAGAEAFWKLADDAVNASGVLAARYEQVRNLELAAREKTRRKEQAAREEQAARRLSRKRAQSPVPVISGPAAIVVCPNCCHSFELVPRLRSGQEPGGEISS